MNQPECDNVSVFSWRAALFHASAWVSIQLSLSACVCVCVCLLECARVSKHKLWAANGACSCCCVSHFSFQSTASYVAYGCVEWV